MDQDLKKSLSKIANTVSLLAIEGVQKANSGHPGLPMGCAEIGAFLYGHHMRYNSKNPNWLNRDRLVLSAGHGSMWLYSFLHLSGFNLPMDELKRFRQLHSITPGHPEYHITEGVEVTTGPLGQGVANAAGMALGMKILEQKFNTEEHTLLNNKVFCLAGDGCIMEGISSEASSLAGHLGLDNLVIIYDSNNICLDGPLAESCSEDTKARYRSYGFEVYEIDAYDFDQMEKVFTEIREDQQRPVFIVAHTIIGRNSPNKAGTHKAHGAPLGEDEIKLVKKELGFPEEPFYVPQSVRAFFQDRQEKLHAMEEKWKEVFYKWSKTNPALFKDFENMSKHHMPEDLEEELKKIEMKNPIAGRGASQAVLNILGKLLPQIYGGSADLSCSDLTMMKSLPIIGPQNFKGRNIKFGVREFGMSGMVNGMSALGLIVPYCGTFLTFSDYMRNAIRLAALSKYHVIYQFTHDSIFLGEDGPTHQPIEHYMTLRAIPHLHVIRPADSYEVRMAWLAALKYEGPTALILTRQALPDLPEAKVPYEEGMGKGAYILKKEKGDKPDYTLFATGSEVSLSMDVAQRLEKVGKKVRVVSFPCWEIFEDQSSEYKNSVLGGDLGHRVSIEAGSDLGWYKYIGPEGTAICMEGFGQSAPISDLTSEFGFTPDAIVERLIS